MAAGLDQWFGGFESKWTFLLVANLVFLVGGMFLDATSLGVIVGPLLVAAGMQYGIPPVAIGVILGVNGAIGMYTPPFCENMTCPVALAKLMTLLLPRSFPYYPCLRSFRCCPPPKRQV